MRLFDTSFESFKTALGGFTLVSLIVGFLCIAFVHAAPAHAATHSEHHVHASQNQIVDACCSAEVSSHMELWKGTLTGILQNFEVALALILLTASVGFLPSDFFATPHLTTNVLYSRYRQYTRTHPDVGVFNILRLALAKGLLNPKLF